MDSDPLENIATSSRLRNLAQNGQLNRNALERAFAIAGYIPAGTDWVKFANYVLLVLGSAFTISGIFFFFAYNWASLHHFLKFGVIEAALLLATGLAYYKGLDKLSGKAALLTAAFLVGVLQAVYGQVYQTGADSYLLFLVWAVLISGWVLISRQALLWFIWLVLLNLTLIFYWAQVRGTDTGLFLSLFTLNAISLLLWEFGRQRGLPWLAMRWMLRLIAAAALAAVVSPTLAFVFSWGQYGFGGDSWQVVGVVLYGVFIGLGLLFYYHKVHDLFMLTIGAFSLMVVITCILVKFAIEILGASQADIISTILFMALFIGGAVIGQGAAAFFWLRNTARSWEAKS